MSASITTPVRRVNTKKKPIDLSEIDRDIEEEHPEDDGHNNRYGGDNKARYTPAKQIRWEVHRRSIDVFHRLIVFAIVNYRPRDTGHHMPNVHIEGITQVDIGEDRRIEIRLGDDAVHDNQNRCAGEGFDERIDGEEKWIGPIRLDLPTQPGCQSKRTPGKREKAC